ncbi:MAG: M48 family metalloprotease [Chitinophagaceae bacterium]|nr:M48 family metalloprotease [Oligoflexus sp.]
MKYIVFPLLTLLGVVVTAVMWVNLFHVQLILEATGISITEWLWIDIAWTIGSGLFSWGLSQDISIWSTDTNLMDDTDKDHPLVQKVNHLAQEIGLTHIPLIGVYPSPEVNLFSAGPWQKRTVLSVSQGFLELSEVDQSILVYAELAKIKSNDTALLVFCHGMTHGFVLYLSRLLAFFLGTSFRQTEGSSSSTYPEILVNIITTFFLTLWGSAVVFAFARRRHREGDRAVLARYGQSGLSKELLTLERTMVTLEHYDLFTVALKANHKPRFWEALMPTHPALKSRHITAS